MIGLLSLKDYGLVSNFSLHYLLHHCIILFSGMPAFNVLLQFFCCSHIGYDSTKEILRPGEQLDIFSRQNLLHHCIINLLKP